MTRKRLRELGITVGTMPTGPHNAITDVPGVWVGHATLVRDEPSVARTGVTVIVPRGEATREDFTFAGFHRFNGCGEMTGLLWVEESGLLCSPVAITNTFQVGLVRDTLIRFAVERYGIEAFHLPVVGETYDGWLNDISAFPLTREHLFEAMDAAGPGPVAEGNVGGGTGMICHGFKGGIGTASRLADCKSGRYTVGALVQANYGARADLRVDGVPVGRKIGPDRVPLPFKPASDDSSIIVVVATDASLLPTQCRRLAQRATVGLARVGGVGHNTSGDIFLAFVTGHHIPADTQASLALEPTVSHRDVDPLFHAVAEAVEESILNALTAAETMTGFQGRTVHALPLDELQRVMAQYGRGGES